MLNQGITTMIVGQTYQEHGRRDLNLAFWTEDGNYIGRGFLVRESNPAVRLILDVVNEYIFVSE
jgi:hypothetical protein